MRDRIMKKWPQKPLFIIQKDDWTAIFDVIKIEKVMKKNQEQQTKLVQEINKLSFKYKTWEFLKFLRTRVWNGFF